MDRSCTFFSHLTRTQKNREDVHVEGYIDLGKLKGNIGSQNYEIPGVADIQALNSVVIYCLPFHVVFSVATF